MTKPYFLAVTNKPEYKRLFKTEEMSDIKRISTKGKIPASSCKRDTLFAFYAVVIKSAIDIPPVHNNQKVPMSTDKDSPELTGYIGGVKTEEIKGLFEHQLTHVFGFSLGQTWGVLHKIKESLSKRRDISAVEKGSVSSPVRKYPKRNAGAKNYAPEPGSDPIEPPSSQGSNSSYTEDVTAKDLQTEDHTVRLATCVLRHIINYTQDQDVGFALEVRERSRQLSLVLPKVLVTFTSIDDGGLCLRLRGREGIHKNFIALLEAKRRLYESDRKPQISDEALVQMACEAILARATQGDEVFGERQVT
ncbi:hypothetical protein ACHAP5_010322 [Fusarium lateritium]